MDPQPRLHPTTPGAAALRPDTPAATPFAHASEAELARILDFYGVSWEYEPDTFPLVWNIRGEVIESFTPDFFLPELDLYVELTTLRQKLVRKKNRKLRRMRELYPDIRVKLLYGKDFRALLLKFGRIGLADALSGTVGQTTPPRIPEHERSNRVRSARESGATTTAVDDAAAHEAATQADPRARASRSRRPGRRTAARRTPERADDGASVIPEAPSAARTVATTRSARPARGAA